MNWYRLRPGVEVPIYCGYRDDSWLAWQPESGSGEANLLDVTAWRLTILCRFCICSLPHCKAVLVMLLRV
jgi:hypothetical protein